LSHIGIHDRDPPLLQQEHIGQPRQKGGFPGVCGTKKQDRTSLSEVIQRGLPTWLFHKPRHRLHLSVFRADDVPPGPGLLQYSCLLDAPSRRSQHQPPHGYGGLCLADDPPDTGLTSIGRKLLRYLVARLMPMRASHIYGSAYTRSQMPLRSTTNELSMKRRHQSRQRGFTRMYDGGMHGG
jgi:hypothetical protein